MSRVGLFAAVRQSSLEDWKETLNGFGFNVLGALLPSWGTALLLPLFGHELLYGDFAKHGEFALYSAAFLSPALFVILRHMKKGRYVLGSGFALFVVAGLLASALVYAGVTSAAPIANATTMSNSQSLNDRYLVVLSTLLLLFSLVVTMLVSFVENKTATFNMQEVESQEQDKLREKFEKKRGSGDGGN